MVISDVKCSNYQKSYPPHGFVRDWSWRVKAIKCPFLSHLSHSCCDCQTADDTAVTVVTTSASHDSKAAPHSSHLHSQIWCWCSCDERPYGRKKKNCSYCRSDTKAVKTAHQSISFSAPSASAQTVFRRSEQTFIRHKESTPQAWNNRWVKAAHL